MVGEPLASGERSLTGNFFSYPAYTSSSPVLTRIQQSTYREDLTFFQVQMPTNLVFPTYQQKSQHDSGSPLK